MFNSAQEENSDRVNILLMTATVTPGQSPELARTDPALRLGDYREALAFYIDRLDTAIDGIVFVENSDRDVSSLADMAEDMGAGDRVEFITNYGKHSYPARDRSYGETRLLDHAMATSRMIARAGDRGVIWKITGRYRVRNLARMVKTAPHQFDLYCDVRRRPIAWLDLRFMAWTKQGYDRLLRGIADRLGTDPKEPAMYDYVTGLADDAIVLRYRTEPLVDGVRGWDNRSYSQGNARLKFWVRSAARTLLPSLWI